MKPSPRDSTPPSPPAPDDATPGIPGFRTWRGVYLFVFAAFVIFVIALTLFSRAYA